MARQRANIPYVRVCRRMDTAVEALKGYDTVRENVFRVAVNGVYLYTRNKVACVIELFFLYVFNYVSMISFRMLI